ncbi:agmatinase [Candidatus Acetothermia bacterium]|nr:agmatinase [Candidatus Acetothermia bacterium]MBI3661129.1 agmatinase [Candidatus Acetothermia bacterium]
MEPSGGSSEISSRYAGIPLNFGGLAPEFSRFDKSAVVVLPVPYDLTTSYMPGTRRGPLAILEASTHLELYDEELQREPYKVGIHTLDSLEPSAASPAETIDRVEEAIEFILKEKKFPVMLGGEHSLTLAPARALQKKYKNFTVLQLDAHSDLRDSYQNTKFNHACVARRMYELGLNIVQIGIRAISSEEATFIEKSERLSVLLDYELHQDPSRIESVLKQLQGPVYVTLDLDVFEPGLMPAVGTPEPGGLNWYTMLRILRTIGDKHEVLGFDVVELCPIPGLVSPDFLSAKLVYKMVGYFLR